MKTMKFTKMKKSRWEYLIRSVFIVLTFLTGYSSLSAQFTETFVHTGAEQTWTVPLTVTSIDIVVKGAAGGSSTDVFREDTGDKPLEH